jgi:hypothetical protein
LKNFLQKASVRLAVIDWPQKRRTQAATPQSRTAVITVVASGADARARGLMTASSKDGNGLPGISEAWGRS